VQCKYANKTIVFCVLQALRLSEILNNPAENQLMVMVRILIDRELLANLICLLMNNIL